MAQTYKTREAIRLGQGGEGNGFGEVEKDKEKNENLKFIGRAGYISG